MRTTIDISENLLREARSAAALRGIKFKDLVDSFFAQGLRQLAPLAKTRRVAPEPLFKIDGRAAYSLTSAEIEDIFAAEDAKLSDV